MLIAATMLLPMAVASLEQAFFVSGGTMPEKARSYVERAADKQLHQCLMGGLYSYVLNSRQMGKSSLCVRARMRLEDQGVRTAFIDLTRIGGRNVTAEQWYAGLVAEISRSLNLRTELLRYWKENDHLSPLQRLFTSLGDVVLATIKEPLVIFVDEIDATRSLQFDTDEFFAGIRECFSRRVQDERYNRLTFCLLGVAVPSDLIRNSQSTPFNIGERIYLRDFTLEETQGFAAGLPFREGLVERVHYWTGGHPFLTQSLCGAIGRDDSIQTTSDVDHLVEREFLDSAARESNMNLSDVGSRVVNGCPPGEDVEKFRANILSSYKWSLKNRKAIPDDESNRLSAVLKLSGLMRSEDGFLTVRNRIYRRAFNAAWIKENMPGQELHRQKRAMWLGVSRTAAIALVGLILIGTLAYRNNQFRQLALKERDRANSELYSADMILMSDLWQKGDIKRMRTMLSDVRATRMKGWEWQLWNRLASRDQRVVFQQGVSGANLSKDGSKLLVHLRNAYGIFDAKTFTEIKTWPAQVSGAGSAGWFPDGKTWFESASDGTVYIRDTSSGKTLGKITDCWMPANFNAVSDDGRWAMGGDSVVRPALIDFKAMTRKVITGDMSITWGAITRDASMVAMTQYFHAPNVPPAVSVRELPSLKEVGHIVTNGTPICVAFTPNGDRLITGSKTGWIQCWNAKTSEELWNVKGQTMGVQRINTSDDGRTMVTTGRENVGTVYSISGTGATPIKAYPDAIDGTISPDGNTAYFSGGSLRAYDVAAEDAIPRIRLPHTEYSKVQIGADGKVLALSDSGGLDVIDSLGSRHPDSLGFKDCIGLGSYHPWVFRKVADRGIEMTNTISSESVGILPIRETPTLLVEFQKASKVFVVHGKDGQVWDTKTGHGEQTYSFDQNITAAAVSSDDGILAIGQASGVISIFELHGRFRKTHGVHTSEVLSIRFIDGDKNLLSTSTDGNATVTELATAKPSQTLVGHSQPVNAVTVSPDGLRFVTGGDDRIVRVWDVETGHELTLLKGYEGPIAAVQFSQDGKTLITVDRAGVVLLWPTEDSWRSEQFGKR